MALLIVEHHGTRRMAPLARRILIGRRSGNHVVINDRAVAMIHAWIDKRGDECVLTDTGSRTGTLVNGKRITRPLPLVDGDVITVGPATLTFQANGETAPQEQQQQRTTSGPAIAVQDRPPPSTTPPAAPIPPAGVPAPVAAPPEPPAAQRVELTADGWLFDCACGAPLWAGASFAGRTAYCRYCGREVRVPEAATVGSQPLTEDAPPAQAYVSTPVEETPPPRHEAPLRHSTAESDADRAASAIATADVETVFVGPPLGDHPQSEIAAKPIIEPLAELRKLFSGDEAAPTEPPGFSSDISEAIATALERATHEAPADLNNEAQRAALAEAVSIANEPEQPPAPRSESIEPPPFTPVVTTIAPEAGSLPSNVLAAAAPPSILEKKPDLAPQHHPAARHADLHPTADALTPSVALPAASVVVTAQPALAPAKPASAPSISRHRTAPPPPAKPKTTPLRATRTCGICQSGILFNEKTTTCPSCGLTFHADCWVENRGCSAYGCPQVGILDERKPDDSGANADAARDDDAAVVAEAAAVEREAAKAYAVKAPFPWEFATLAASAFCLLASVLTFGVPSLLIGAGTMNYLSKRPGVRRKTGILLLSTAIALVGFIVGLMASWFFWFDSRSGGGSRP